MVYSEEELLEAKRQIDSSTSAGATIIKSANSSMMMTIWGRIFSG